MEMTTEDLTKALKTLGILRAARETLTARLAAKQAAFEALPSVQQDRADLTTTHELEAKLEGDIRVATLALYAATGDKKPVAGVAVRVTTTYQYEPQQALKWAWKEAPILLKTTLDEKAFQALCKTRKPDFVTVVETPQATISKDLA